MIGYLALLAIMAVGVRSYAAGECRSECAELNLYSIIRVHLKDDLVKLRICKNITSMKGFKSKVTPVICNRNQGIWTFDETTNEYVIRPNGCCGCADSYF